MAPSPFSARRSIANIVTWSADVQGVGETGGIQVPGSACSLCLIQARNRAQGSGTENLNGTTVSGAVVRVSSANRVVWPDAVLTARSR
jgi:hypothetical protein